MNYTEDAGIIVEITRKLLNSIAQKDWTTYNNLCDPNLTCFEPEGKSSLIVGLDFHKYYFENLSSNNAQTTIANPVVRFLGDKQEVAVIAYNRIVQSGKDKELHMSYAEETRVWEKKNGRWTHVHFHRSKN